MKVKDLLKILKECNPDADVQFAVHDVYTVTNLSGIEVDEEYDKQESLCLYASLDEDEYITNYEEES